MSFSKCTNISSLCRAALAVLCLTGIAAVVVACSSGSSSTTAPASSMAKVSVMVSDPATCSGPDGPFSHVYVTITDVQANVSASAGSSDSGWVDLTPSLSSAPKQIDLLGQANNQCFLATLGDAQQLQAGKYQQIRIILASDSVSIANNACGSSANCVMLTSDASSTPHELQLSSEAKTGIKIPSGQIAGGAFNISAGDTKDLDIDFNTCSSIVQQGNGRFLLKPVLHAGEVSTTSTSINGKVLDAATGNPIDGNAFVSLEQPDANGVDRVFMSTVVNADGTFVFCPLPSGTYDVVVVGARSSDGALYRPSIVTGVSTGSTVGTVQLNPPQTSLASVSNANLNGTVTSSTASAVLSVSVLEMANTKTYTIPQQPAASPFFLALQQVTTASSSSCPGGAPECVNYSLPVTSGSPYIGAWSSSGATLAPASNAPLASYAVDATSTTCTTAEATTNPALTLAQPGPFTNVAVSQVLAFTGCQ